MKLSLARARGWDLSAVPGLQDLWSLTTGTPEVCIAVLDGPVDLSHPAFAGAQLEQLAFGTRRPTDDVATRHGTHVASIIFGQHESSVRGVAPRASGVIIPVFESRGDDTIAPCSQIDLARAIQQATEYGAQIINVSGGEYSPSGSAHPILANTVERCVRQGVLIVAAAGNDGCRCVHVPGSLPWVLPVGAIDAQGKPFGFSNWGDAYQATGVLAFGENLLGAVPGGGIAPKTGTSIATPIVTGVAGLLLHLQKLSGGAADVRRVKDSIVRSATQGNCDPGWECVRLLAGRLNVKGATQFIINRDISMQETARPIPEHPLPAESDVRGSPQSQLAGMMADHPTSPVSTPNGATGVVPSDAVAASACSCQGGGTKGATIGQRVQLVFALGKIGYDFQTEARRDTIIANMEVPPDQVQGNPYDQRQLIHYLEQNPAEAARITWTLNHDATPIYAIQPVGAFAAQAYGILVGFLRDQLKEGVEVVSIPGVIIGNTRLFTGQSVPVVAPEIRAMYSWTIAKLVEAVVGPEAKKEEKPPEGTPLPPEGSGPGNLPEALDNFLRRIYFEFRNLGLTSQDRAINFAGTQIFRIARYLERQHRRGNQLDTIEIHRSPICRPESDCWDVKIIFFDPENVMRARSAFLVTVDVSDSVPVMISDGIREFSVR